MRTLRTVTALGALAALAARPALRNWGATAQERARSLPGDGLICDERGICTMAITIRAPASAIWPWLAQMGTDRAGWYSWDRLDNGGRASASTIDPRWTEVSDGDRFVTVPGRSWFEVAHVEPQRSLVLRSTLDARGRPYDPSNGRPRAFMDARWEFFCDPLEHGSTRLLVRSGSASGPQPWSSVGDWLFWQPAHVVMQLRQLHELRRRAEGPAATAAEAGPDVTAPAASAA